MKKFLIIFVLLGIILISGCTWAPQQLQPQQPQQSGCNELLWNHVYNPSRLEIIDPCIIVTGTVDKIRKEPDGDYHIMFRLDPAYEYLLNQGNIEKQNGTLVVEPICQFAPTQESAKGACEGFVDDSPKFKPVVGSRYELTGSYVYDTHHNWMEIHPLSSMVLLGA